MSWAVGYDENWKRDVGYGVPATCDHPDCNEEIDRGLAYVCGDEMYGGDRGCGLFFCPAHRSIEIDNDDEPIWPPRCDRCIDGDPPFAPKPDLPVWNYWKLTDDSWAEWRAEHPDWVREHQQIRDAVAVLTEHGIDGQKYEALLKLTNGERN